MKTIGILGGISPESTLDYYRLLNKNVRKIMGGYHSAKLLIYSFDFAQIHNLQNQGNWEEIRKLFTEKAHHLLGAGADFLILASNTSHKALPQGEVGAKFLHIADCLGENLQRQGIVKAGLLGTQFLMQGSFYKDILEKKYETRIVVPNPDEQKKVNEIIFKHLVKGKYTQKDCQYFYKVMNNLQKRSEIEVIILGCTEIARLTAKGPAPLPLFDTKSIHIKAAVAKALQV